MYSIGSVEIILAIVIFGALAYCAFKLIQNGIRRSEDEHNI